jgi:hypothetical protein
MVSIDPTVEQLRTFYRVVRQSVLLSSYIAFVEMNEDQTLFVYIKRYDELKSIMIVYIAPDGEVNNEI